MKQPMLKTVVALVLFASTLFAAGTMPFPRSQSYGLKPSNATDAAMATSVQNRYNWYISTFLKTGDVGGKYIEAKDTDGSRWTETVSEAHGYGMMLAAIMDDKTTFDQMVTFYDQYTRTTNSLMQWQVWGGGSAEDGSATDGDLDIAYALLLADKQWGGTSYKNLALTIIGDIWDNDMYTSGTYKLPNPGDSWFSNNTFGAGQYTRPSDWMAGHFRAFEVANPANDWTGAATSVYSFYNSYRNSTTGLVPDFFYGFSGASGSAEIEGPTDDQYHYNACRVPLRFAMDFATSGNSSAQAACQKIGNWINGATSSNADNIASGYYLNGGEFNTAYTDLVFQGPFGAAQIATSNQAMLNSVWSATTSDWNYQTDNAYGAAVSLLSMLVMSGNWWAPNSTPVANTAPTNITISNSTVVVGGTTTVGTLATVDANDFGTHTYTTTTSGWTIFGGSTLIAPSGLSEGVVSVSVKTTDAGGLSYTKNLSITVLPSGSATGVDLVMDDTLYVWEVNYDTAGGTTKVSNSQTNGNIGLKLTFPAVNDAAGIYPYGSVSYYDDATAFDSITSITITYKSDMATSVAIVQNDAAYADGGSHEYLLASSGGVAKTVTVAINNTNFKNPQWWIDEGNTAKTLNFSGIVGLSVAVEGAELGGTNDLVITSFMVEGFSADTITPVSKPVRLQSKGTSLSHQLVGGAVSLNFSLSSQANVKVSLYTPAGRQVASVNANGLAGANNLRLSTQGLSKGLYLLRFEAAGAVETTRINLTR